jgi:hypothetical protein
MIMRIWKYLFGLITALTLLSCELPEEEPKKQYPAMESIEDTLWYSTDIKNQIYYDINYAETTGTMIGYNSSKREEVVSSRTFTYTFTPATKDIDALVHLSFEDGAIYDGILVPKGNFKVDNKDVYWIQLYEVDDTGHIIYDDNGKMKSSILMWRE